MHPRAKKKQQEKLLAKEHIKELFAQADDTFSTDSAAAHRYVQMARKIQMKFKVYMPREYKRKYCKHCYHYLRSGENGRVRVRDGKLTIYCGDCKKFTRIPIQKK